MMNDERAATPPRDRVQHSLPHSAFSIQHSLLFYTCPIMVFNVEIVLKGREYTVTETIVHEGRDAPAWTDEDVESVITEMLRALDRAANPGEEERAVTLKRF